MCSLHRYNCDMMELRRRYQSLYIPSDFFDAVFTWVDAFSLSRPFTFGNYCNFHIMHKEVDSLVKNTAVLDPPDANHTYSAKVWGHIVPFFFFFFFFTFFCGIFFVYFCECYLKKCCLWCRWCCLQTPVLMNYITSLVPWLMIHKSWGTLSSTQPVSLR